MKFEKISVENGLSQSVVECICQDSRGFLWFGTQQGINKYDGYRLKVYLNDPFDNTSLKYDSIQTIHNDRNGKLWIGSYCDTISCFNITHDNFSNINIRKKSKNKQAALPVSSIAEDLKGNLWIGTYEGLIKYTAGTGKVNYFNNNVSKADLVPGDDIYCVFAGEDDSVFIGTRDNGISIFKEKDLAFENYKITGKENSGERGNRIFDIYKDRDNNLLVSTGAGLKIFDPVSKKFKNCSEIMKTCDLLNIGMIQCVTEDKNSNLWIGTRNNGIIFYDRKLQNLKNFRFNKSDMTTISSNRILCLYNDASNVLWAGTFAGGVCKADLEQKKFYHVKEVKDEKKNTSSCKITSFLDDGQNLWIGTHGDGLFRVNKENNNTINYRNDVSDKNSLKGISVFSLFKDERALLWAGVSAEGINRYNYDSGTFDNFKLQDSNYYEVSSIIKFNGDKNKKLLIGTTGPGIFIFDTAEEKFIPFLSGTSESGAEDYVKCMLIDSDGYLWVGTINQGLRRINLKTNETKLYKSNSQNINCINDNYVTAILEDSSKNLWFGTRSGGLNKYNKKEDTFIHFTTKNGLPNNFISGLVEGESGILWISTNKGLSKFDISKESFRNYDSDDGLQSNEFNEYAYHKSADGTIYFGGLNGYNYFDPDEIKDNPYIPKVVITDFLIFNNSVESSPDNPFLKKNITVTEDIMMSYRESVFSFEFAALSFNNPEKNKYAYKMEGFDKEWIYSGNRRFVTYTNLQPGDYIFRVKGSNNDGVWNEEGAKIKITITPPFWKKWWFKSLGGMSIIGTLALAYHRQLSQMQREKGLQEEYSRKLLESQEDERKRIANDLHHTIAHDILITKNKAVLGLKKAEDSKAVKDILNEISELASGTLNDVRSISYNLHPHQIERLGMTKALRSIINGISNSSEIKFTCNADNIDNILPGELEINIFRIIQECANNILKHSGADEATLNVIKDFKTITITIWDNGKGIPKNRMDGLGLTGIEERVKLYKGELVIESSPNKGTLIAISLPYINKQS